jgi:hypothetical protein
LGTAFAESIASLKISEREKAIEDEILKGNVPEHLRKLHPVTSSFVTNGITNTVTFYVACDYLCVGSEDDFFLTPLTPITAQRIATKLDCLLPTPQMVDAIYVSAEVKMIPEPITPSPLMTTVPVFIRHNELVKKQRETSLAEHPFGSLVAGHKKDVVVSAKLKTANGKVAIYGWHKRDGKPIQPLYLGHVDWWADYSHGIRLVSKTCLVNGKTMLIPEMLADAVLAPLLSNEGLITQTTYPTEHKSQPTDYVAPAKN